MSEYTVKSSYVTRPSPKKKKKKKRKKTTTTQKITEKALKRQFWIHSNGKQLYSCVCVVDFKLCGWFRDGDAHREIDVFVIFDAHFNGLQNYKLNDEFLVMIITMIPCWWHTHIYTHTHSSLFKHSYIACHPFETRIILCHLIWKRPLSVFCLLNKFLRRLRRFRAIMISECFFYVLIKIMNIKSEKARRTNDTHIKSFSMVGPRF